MSEYAFIIHYLHQIRNEIFFIHDNITCDIKSSDPVIIFIIIIIIFISMLYYIICILLKSIQAVFISVYVHTFQCCGERR